MTKVLFLLAVFIGCVSTCEEKLACTDCLENGNCEFIVLKSYNYICSEKGEKIADVRVRFTDANLCSRSLAMVQRFAQRTGIDAANLAGRPEMTDNFRQQTTVSRAPSVTQMTTPIPQTTTNKQVKAHEPSTTVQSTTTAISTFKPHESAQHTTVHENIENKTRVATTIATSVSVHTPSAEDAEEKDNKLLVSQIKQEKKNAGDSQKMLVQSPVTKNDTTVTGEYHVLSTFHDQQRDGAACQKLNTGLNEEREIFMKIPYDLAHCRNGTRNETLMLRYVFSLCRIERLARRIGYENFNETDKSYLMLNRGRHFGGICMASQIYRKKCRIHNVKCIIEVKKSLSSGPKSLLFINVDPFPYCMDNVKKESKYDRIARHLCNAGDLFLRLRNETRLNNYDDAYGMMNPCHRHADVCYALSVRYARCY